MIDESRPILVGAKTVIAREFDPSIEGETLSLMAKACEQAADNAGSRELLAEADEFLCPQGFWPYSNPGRLLAQRFDNSKASTTIAMIGVSQQSMINRAMDTIASGENDIAVVFGGETKYRVLQSMIQAAEFEETVQEGDEPDFKWESPDILWSDIEAERGLVMPTEFYALMESSLQHSFGHSHDEHRRYLGNLYQGFSEIAVNNPVAWRDTLFTAEAIASPENKNTYLAFPYTKLHNSQWNVNLASALIFCSQKKARELGLDESQWVYPTASAESNHVVPLTQRPILHRHEGTKACGDAVFSYTNMSANDVQHVDLYSCFPAAVQSHAIDLGLPLDRPLTVTGGMSFSGGPINNFVIQSHVAMAERLREHKQDKGLVSCISGINGKQGVTLYQSAKPELAYKTFDVTDTAVAAMPEVPIDASYEGQVTVIAQTVAFAKGLAQKAFVVGETTEGVRVLATSENNELIQCCLNDVLCGTEVRVAAGECFII